MSIDVRCKKTRHLSAEFRGYASVPTVAKTVLLEFVIRGYVIRIIVRWVVLVCEFQYT